MNSAIFRSSLLAAAVGFSSLAFAATGVQTTDMPASPASSGQMHSGMHHGMQHGMQHHRGYHSEGMREMDKLDLTATQRTNIKQMMRNEYAQAQPQMQALMQKRMTFENATPGSADYQTAADQFAQAEGKAAEARVARQATLRTKIYSELTPAQRTQLASLRSERQARMQKWRANRDAKRAVNPAPAATSAMQN